MQSCVLVTHAEGHRSVPGSSVLTSSVGGSDSLTTFQAGPRPLTALSKTSETDDAPSLARSDAFGKSQGGAAAWTRRTRLPSTRPEQTVSAHASSLGKVT